EKLFGKFDTIEAIRNGLPMVTDVDFMPTKNQLPNDSLFV
ncbi:hypothetical protein LSAT2_023761, partial [Lamellibrachia satsuma]